MKIQNEPYRELGSYRVIEGYCSLFNMATKTTISGFETIRVKFDINSDAHHVMYLKSHSVREEDKRTPNDKTLFVLNVPPYCTKVGKSKLHYSKPRFSYCIV